MISAASVQKNPQNSPFLNKPFTLKLFAILKLMLFATPVFAQKKSELTLQWKVANELPAETGKAVSIGVAGPVTGVYKDRFIVAGGANFPGGMPWEGGAKKNWRIFRNRYHMQYLLPAVIKPEIIYTSVVAERKTVTESAQSIIPYGCMISSATTGQEKQLCPMHCAPVPAYNQMGIRSCFSAAIGDWFSIKQKR